MNLSDVLKDLMRPRATGEALDIDVERLATEARAPGAPSRDGIWRESSFELQRGLEVSEQPLDSMPAELIDVFRKP